MPNYSLFSVIWSNIRLVAVLGRIKLQTSSRIILIFNNPLQLGIPK